MESKRLQGSFVAIVTPFNHDGSIDFEGFRTLIDFHATHQTSALLIMGSTGEVSMLSEDERHQVISETSKFKKKDLLLFSFYLLAAIFLLLPLHVRLLTILASTESHCL